MRLIFAGTPGVAARSLQLIASKHEIALVLTRPDAPIGRKRVITPSPVAEVAAQLGLKVHKTKKIDAETELLIEQAESQLAIVAAYGTMIPEAALSKLPWLNLHFSLLPEWRGASPLQHSMIYGTGIGVTVFLLDQGLDTGRIVAQRPLQFLPDESAGLALERFADIGTEVLLEALEADLEAKPQVGIISSAPKLSRQDAKLNFTRPADELNRFILAMNPEPMAWSIQNGEPVRILKASVVTEKTALEAAHETGDIFNSESKQVLVQCGELSALILETVQPAGKRETAANDWWNGLKGKAKFD